LEEFDVGVVGAGHIGLVTSASLADIGHWITLVDVDEDTIEWFTQREAGLRDVQRTEPTAG
jgi:UDP-glucose 6-dehydrogenase